MFEESDDGITALSKDGGASFKGRADSMMEQGKADVLVASAKSAKLKCSIPGQSGGPDQAWASPSRGHEMWSGESEQSVKWTVCLKTAMLRRIGRRYDEAYTPPFNAKVPLADRTHPNRHLASGSTGICCPAFIIGIRQVVAIAKRNVLIVGDDFNELPPWFQCDGIMAPRHDNKKIEHFAVILR